MIPMRDGVKLHTVIIVPAGARNAPILLTRTPYNASKRTERNASPHMLATLPQGSGIPGIGVPPEAVAPRQVGRTGDPDAEGVLDR